VPMAPGSFYDSLPRRLEADVPRCCFCCPKYMPLLQHLVYKYLNLSDLRRDCFCCHAVHVAARAVKYAVVCSCASSILRVRDIRCLRSNPAWPASVIALALLSVPYEFPCCIHCPLRRCWPC
jgi:hypothetical protein